MIDLSGSRIPPDPDVWLETAVAGRCHRHRGRMLGSAAWELQSSGLPVLSRARCGKAGRPDFSASTNGGGVAAESPRRWTGVEVMGGTTGDIGAVNGEQHTMSRTIQVHDAFHCGFAK
jgi:hypothetical protein